MPGLDRLEALFLHRNFLHELPEHVGDMTGLKQLTAYGNALSLLPHSIGGLRALALLALLAR